MVRTRYFYPSLSLSPYPSLTVLLPHSLYSVSTSFLSLPSATSVIMVITRYLDPLSLSPPLSLTSSPECSLFHMVRTISISVSSPHVPQVPNILHHAQMTTVTSCAVIHVVLAIPPSVAIPTTIVFSKQS